MALTDKLSAIGNAIRAKTGGTELLTLDAMPNEIASIQTGGGGGIEVEPIVLTGNQSYGCSGPLSSKYIEMFSNTITTNDLFGTEYMFFNSTLKKIPFNLNYQPNNKVAMNQMFANARYLQIAPKINNAKFYNLKGMFTGCEHLVSLPVDYFDNFDVSGAINSTSSYTYDASYIFYGCKSLRSIPVEWFNNMNPNAGNYYVYFYYGFNGCYLLDELVDLPIPYTSNMTGNMFYSCFEYCRRLKRITFKTQEDGSPMIMNWKNQTIDLSKDVGCILPIAALDDCNTTITKDKFVDSDEKYQALKNDPDWFTYNSQWSRYNKTSAIETINSLPDTSAYLATAGGTNTIKFKGGSGSSTDGGAINTMTEEEIAVAAAKGWTVTFVP